VYPVLSPTRVSAVTVPAPSMVATAVAVSPPVVAQGPRMPELSLLSEPRDPLKFDKSTLPVPWLTAPDTLKVRPEDDFHVCLPLSVRPLPIVRSWLAELMSMPEVPTVSVSPALKVTAPPGFVTLRPEILKFPPRSVVFAEVTVESHWAMSVVPGTTEPVQLVVRLRLSLLSAFEIVAPRKGENSMGNNTNQKATGVRRAKFIRKYGAMS